MTGLEEFNRAMSVDVPRDLWTGGARPWPLPRLMPVVHELAPLLPEADLRVLAGRGIVFTAAWWASEVLEVPHQPEHCEGWAAPLESGHWVIAFTEVAGYRPPDTQRFVVSHELAHVFIGTDRPDGYHERECGACRQQIAWGFAPDVRAKLRRALASGRATDEQGAIAEEVLAQVIAEAPKTGLEWASSTHPWPDA